MLLSVKEVKLKYSLQETSYYYYTNEDRKYNLEMIAFP